MLIYTLTTLLISNALTLRKDKSILFSRIVIISLFLNVILCLNNTYTTALSKGIGIFGGLFHVTIYTQAFNIFLFIVCIIILTLTSFYPRWVFNSKTSSIYNLIVKGSQSRFVALNDTCAGGVKALKKITNKQGEQFKIIEYSLIVVFVICGAVFLMSASDLVSVFLSIELQSYGLYIISTIYRDSEQATSGGLTYFLLGGLSSCFILLGSSLLYVNSGTTSLEGIYLISSISNIAPNASDAMLVNESLSLDTLSIWYNSYYIHLSLIILSVGFLFKVSAAPFHFWSPDVYDAIPTIVTTFVAIVAKISIFIFLLELVYYTEKNLFSSFSWVDCLLISSLFSLIIGSVLGLTQFRIKRLFAYSTISHVGFILLALSIDSIESIQAYLFYILAYTISNLNGFMILTAIGYSFYRHVYKDNALAQGAGLMDKNNSPIQLISQLKGYFYVNSYLALSLGITLFSFVGVPPLIGFFAKQMVLSSALDSGYVFMSLLAIITSVIGAVYYLSIIKEIFFFKDEYTIPSSLENIDLKGLNSISVNHINEETSSDLNSASAKASPSPSNIKQLNKQELNSNSIVLSSALSGSISIITLLLLLFIFTTNEWFETAYILTLSLFKL